MAKRAIKSVKDLPDWFNLDKYEGAKDLGAAGWCYELRLRVSAETYPNIFDKARLLSVAERAQEHGSVAEVEAPQLVESMQLSEVLHIFEGISGGTNLVDEWKEAWRRFPYSDIGPEFAVPLDQHYEQPGVQFLTVTLDAPDDLLIDAFRKWLAEERNRTAGKYYKRKRKQTNKFTSADFQSWAINGVLPYLDLKQWSEAEGVHIPQRVYGSAIFRDDRDPVETLRKLTMRHAKELMDANLLIMLQVQAEVEAAEAERKN